MNRSCRTPHAAVLLFLFGCWLFAASALAQNQGRVLTRDRLISLVQGDGVAVVDRTVDTHVFGLRKKLEGAGDLLETVRGVGYRIRATI